MKTERIGKAKVIGTWYSVKNEGNEVYCEDIKPRNIDITSEMERKLALLKLSKIRKAMPAGTWTITIKQQRSDGSYRIFNPGTGETKGLGA